MKKTSIISKIFRRMFLVQIMIQLIGIIGNVIDGMVTGRFLGENAIVAYGLSVTVTLIIALCGSVLSMGTSMVCSKQLGEGNLKQTRHVFSACFTVTLIFSTLLLLIIFIFAEPIAKGLAASDEIIPLTADYLRGYAIAAPGIIFVAFLMPIMQMDGEMNRLMIAVVLMTAGDIAADLLNVTVFHGGMFGMALATAVSYYLALLILLLHFSKKEIIFTFPKPVFDLAVTRKMLRGGAANAASQLGRLVMTYALNLLLMKHSGVTAVTANAVIMSMANLCLVPGSAIADTAQVMAGVLCGEEDRRGIVQMVRTALKVAVLVNGTAILLFELSAVPLVGLFFNGSAEALPLTVIGFRFYVLTMIVYSVNAMYRCFCQGSGQIRKAFIITALDCLIFPLIAALVLELTLGAPAVWLAHVIGEGTLTLLIMAWLRKRNAGRSGLEAIVPLPKDFGHDILASIEYSFSEKDPHLLVARSQEVHEFCRNNEADPRTAFLLALFVEEAVGNIIEHGFNDRKRHSIDLRILRKKEGWVLRLRDDCVLFNPNKYMEQYTGKDPTENIGLKMIRGASKEIIYLNTLRLNNLIVYL